MIHNYFCSLCKYGVGHLPPKPSWFHPCDEKSLTRISTDVLVEALGEVRP